MATVFFAEHVDGRQASERITTRNEREYRRTYKAVNSMATDGPEIIRLHPGCPRLGQIYVSASGAVDTGCWCNDVRFDQTVDPYTWTVTAGYSNQVLTPELTLVENPLLRPSDVSWDTQEVLVPAEYDALGVQIGTTAGERPDPPLEREEVRLILTIEKNLPTFDPLVAVAFKNRVNAATFFGFNRGMVKLAKWKGQRQFENGLIFWRHFFEFHIKEGQNKDTDDDTGEYIDYNGRDAWWSYFLNRGAYEIRGGKQVPMRTPTGVLSPVPLS